MIFEVIRSMVDVKKRGDGKWWVRQGCTRKICKVRIYVTNIRGEQFKILEEGAMGEA
jgi:hypothetical protein